MHTKLNRIGKLISTIILALLCGAVSTIFFLQYDPVVKEFLGKQIITLFDSSLNCTMKSKLNYINFFSPIAELSDVTVQSKEDKSWQWYCKTCTMSFSWLHFLWYGVIDLHLILEGLEARSDIHNSQPAILEHIRDIIEGFSQDLPVFLKSLKFRKATLSMNDEDTGNAVILSWSGESKVIGSSFKSHLHFCDGSLETANRTLFNQLGGTLECYIPQDIPEEPLVVRVNCSLVIPHLSTSNKNCFLTGYFVKDHGLFRLQSVDGSFICGPLRLTQSAGNLIGEMHARLPLSYLANLLGNTYEENDLSGTCIVQTKAYLSTTPYRLFGTISLYDMRYKQINLSNFSKFSFSKQNQKWNGTFFIHCESEGLLEGTLNYDENTKSGVGAVHNKKKISNKLLESWDIERHNLSCTLSFDPTDGLKVIYNLIASQPKLHTYVELAGTATIDKQDCSTQGTINNNSYILDLSFYPSRLKRFCYHDQEGKSVAEIYSRNADHTKLEGIITFPFIRTIVNDLAHIDLQGEGVLKFWCILHPNNMRLKMHLADGTIRLPHTYNFINRLEAFATVDLDYKKIILNRIHCWLHKGIARCTGAVILLGQQGNIEFLQVPLLLDSCLINNKDDLFAIVSGNLVFTKERNKIPQIVGSLILDRTQLKENIFSHLLKKDAFSLNSPLLDLYGESLFCNLAITTQSPIRINTPFLETMANVNLLFKQNLKNPDITGSIELISGIINFPYKPLYITKAHCHFMSHQPYDPVVEIVAKNRIKKYTIMMCMHGSLQNHQIRLESSPPLSEEQIIGLLLAGSEEESLSIVAPALVMQNIKNLIFSSSSALTGLDSYVKKVFNPFKHIYLVPSFIDQTGRGGLRAAIEIDINERWRALIQKNFSLSEDTRFEVDYFLSDNICFKAVRDEHRDVSGEVEMRWKF
ncbi:hypothetical protein E3J79_02235 [Candidatus Dependentiae bacterium]|nr:MAG: hypothetical protein E3J79_02235 [Candidatus Dependentiae bacterium]